MKKFAGGNTIVIHFPECLLAFLDTRIRQIDLRYQRSGIYECHRGST